MNLDFIDMGKISGFLIMALFLGLTLRRHELKELIHDKKTAWRLILSWLGIAGVIFFSIYMAITWDCYYTHLPSVMQNGDSSTSASSNPSKNTPQHSNVCK
jgi:hypothetical protein